MDWLSGALVIVGLFVLRIGVPLAVTLTVGHLLHHLEAKRQSETRAQQEANQMQNKAG